MTCTMACSTSASRSHVIQLVRFNVLRIHSCMKDHFPSNMSGVRLNMRDTRRDAPSANALDGLKAACFGHPRE